MAGVDYIELSGGFQGLSGDEQVESSEIDNSLISSVNEQFATHRCNAAEWDEAPLYDDVLKSWVAPFMMATINTKNIHRSNMLQNHCYGEAIAKAVAEDTSMATDQTRPGEGPTQEQRETGYINKQGLGANTGCQGRPHL